VRGYLNGGTTRRKSKTVYALMKRYVEVPRNKMKFYCMHVRKRGRCKGIVTYLEGRKYARGTAAIVTNGLVVDKNCG